MSALRRRGANAALANREQYIRLLQETLPERGPLSIHKGHLHGVKRQRLAAAVADHPGEVRLPKGWQSGATRALQLALADIVPRPVIEHNDLFLCSLIHPTFVKSSTGPRPSKTTLELRRLVSMPLEASISGAAALQLIRELLRIHRATATSHEQLQQRKAAAGFHSTGHGKPHQSPSPGPMSGQLLPDQLPPLISTQHLVQVPRAAGLDRLILYDEALFPATAAAFGGLPEEVLLSSVTSLCGAVDLCSGARAVATFLDRVLPRVGSADSF